MDRKVISEVNFGKFPPTNAIKSGRIAADPNGQGGTLGGNGTWVYFIQTLEQGKKVFPREPSIRHNLANVYARVGHGEDALAEAREFVRSLISSKFGLLSGGSEPV